MATINVSELATELNTDARTARKFLRTVTPTDEQPGKGGRWSIEKKSLRSLKSQFSKFEAAAKAPEDEGDESDSPVEETE